MPKVMKNFFIGIDFSKEKFDATLISTRKGLQMENVHNVFPNNEDGYEELLGWLGELVGRRARKSYLFCGEHTGAYSYNAAKWLYEKGYDVCLENPRVIKGSMGLVRGKSDKADSAAIARYCRNRQDELTLFVPMSDEVSTLDALLTLREGTKNSRKSMQLCLKSKSEYKNPSPKVRQLGERMAKLIEAMKDIEDEAEAMIREEAESSGELAANYAIVTSFTGISTINAAAMLVYSDNFRKFSASRQMMCYWGVAPFGRESGSSVHSQPHVSPKANKWLKGLISEAAKCAVRHNTPIKRYYDHLISENKPKGIALNNAKAKIIHIVFSMVRHQQIFNPRHELNRMIDRDYGNVNVYENNMQMLNI